MFNIQGHQEFKVAYIQEFERLRRENEELKQQLFETQQALLEETKEKLISYAHNSWTIQGLASEFRTNARKLYWRIYNLGMFIRNESDTMWMPTDLALETGLVYITEDEKVRISNQGRERIIKFIEKWGI